jgi:hypothetical protein
MTSEFEPQLTAGDVIELTLRGERRTAVAMLVSDDVVLLDLVDDDRMAWARWSTLQDVVIFRPEPTEVLAAA